MMETIDFALEERVASFVKGIVTSAYAQVQSEDTQTSTDEGHSGDKAKVALIPPQQEEYREHHGHGNSEGRRRIGRKAPVSTVKDRANQCCKYM